MKNPFDFYTIIYGFFTSFRMTEKGQNDKIGALFYTPKLTVLIAAVMIK